jgi:hypothetical protein
MNTPKWCGWLVLAGLLATPACADEPKLSFKTAASRDKADFQEKVFEKIVKGARTQPVSIAFDKGEYSTPEKGRKQLKMTGSFKGSVTGKKYDVTITIRLDTTKDDAWAVLKIAYKDSHRLMPSPRESRFADLAKELSK